ncbi:phage portal protein [Peribacillus asahii]|uniref:phage portal protein n=1 Tax=Peribacillus asahii TaxID=228899 RepID=UPI00207AECFF|nr:phage portal protein [Peribacillus asahii]USK85719.1 phage portal protein [Peribacillus asahii]
MGILSSMFEKRNTSSLAEPNDSLLSLFRGGRSTTGKAVNADSALTFSAVYACVRILSETIASLPLPVFERLAQGKGRAKDHYLYKVLHDSANNEMTAFTFRETAMNHLLLEGNFYAEKEFDEGGRVRGLWPLNPHKTWPERVNGELKYKSILPNGTQVVFKAEQIFHIPGMGFDGIKGYNPIKLAREAIGLGLAAEEYGARFFGNGAKPGGVLEHPEALSDNARTNLRSSWNEMHQGLEKQHRIAILEEGMTYKQIGIAPEEAQFLETRKFQVTEIARFFRVPPHMLADLERATFSNIEQQSIDFVTHSIRPWLVRWEQTINSRLLGIDSSRYFAEFVVEGLLRGDIKSRYEAYSIARQNGWLSANDIRAMENQNPIDSGDIYLVPLNMIPADQAKETVMDLSDPDNQRGLP